MATESSLSNTPLSVLHLEDNPTDAELIAAALQEEWPHCRIRRVQDRDEFHEALATGGIDVILSDFSLPHFDGLSALTLARQQDAKVPFIFLSGTIGEEKAVEALRHGATDYILKDNRARLLPAIQRALEEVREQRRRNDAEEQLRETQERFQELAEQSADVFWFVAPDPERTLYLSPAYDGIWQQPREAAMHGADAWTEAIHPADRGRVCAAFTRCMKGAADRFEEEYRIVRPDGSERWLLDSGVVIRDRAGKVIRLSGIAKDITQRRAAEQERLRQASLLDMARDAIVVSAIDGRITYWNQGATRVFGWDAAEAGRMRSVDLFGPMALARIREAGAAPAHGEWRGEISVHARDGRLLVLESRVTLIRNEQGRPESHLIIGTDITEQRKLEKQSLQSQRLESIGVLAGGIAHDLNNILSPILMAVNLVEQQTTDPGIQRLMRVVDASAQRGASLVRQVLAFARGTEGERTQLDPRTIIAEVVTLMGQTLPRSIVIETQIEPSLGRIHADPTQLSQVLMNLCVNAGDAMASGGRLLIRALNTEVGAALAGVHTAARPGPHVLITVEDTGSGIPPETLDRIFDPFFTTKGAGKGTGLGLSTTLGIVKSHGGFVDVQSTPAQGTTFSLYFPAANATAPAPVPTEGAPPERGHGEGILLIEDEADIRQTTELLLEAAGYRVRSAQDGMTGIALYRQHHADISVVITDLMMPSMQGAEVVEELRGIDPDVGIIVMSGGELRQSTVVDKADGRLQFLPKPVSGPSLLAAIRQALHPRRA